MGLLVVLLVQAAGLAALLLLFRFMETTAAVRGTHGEDTLSPRVHRLLRTVFLGIMVGPLVFAFPLLLIPVLAYLPSFLDLSELNGGRPSEWLTTSRLATGLRWYFHLKLVKTVDIDPSGVYLFCIHPHGVLPVGAMANIASPVTGFKKLFPGLRLRGLAASFCFYFPLYRDFCLGVGICDASRYSARRILSDLKMSLFLVPGGATEALYADPAEDVLYITKRFGFVRLAMQHGASLVPVFSFNENNCFDQIQSPSKRVQWARKKFQAIFGLSLPIVRNIIPHRAPITTVIGAPVQVPHIKEPTDEQCREALQVYMKALEDLYAEHGPKYNIPPTKKLRFV